MYQNTLAKSFLVSGKALHSGRIVKLSVHPKPANHGIVFRRTDARGSVPILAHATNISSTELSTTLGEGHSSVSTVEHLMAALFLTGVDNALVEVDGPEIPILDGSSMPFIREIKKAGIKQVSDLRQVFKVIAPLEVFSGDSILKIEPADGFSVNCTIDFDSEVIGRQIASFIDVDIDHDELCRARTFCHINDVNAMRRRGLALGGSLENAVVISDTGILNEEGLRSPNEFAEHKLLDLIGDFALLGRPLIGRITAVKPGHTIHAQSMWELLADCDRYLRESNQLPVTNQTHQSSFYAYG